MGKEGHGEGGTWGRRDIEVGGMGLDRRIALLQYN